MRYTRNISALIRSKRAEFGISQDALALQLGFKNGQYISNVERDLCGFPVKHLNSLSKVIHVSTIQLVDAYKSDCAEYIEGAIATQVKESWKLKE